MTFVRFATATDIAQIKALRRLVFEDELKIQHPDYQDVFNDHYSKNLALVINDEVIGAARLAYNRADASFYISYFLIKAEHRTTRNGSLLLSAILYLLEVNNIAVVKADAYDQLPLFLKLGFVITGAEFTKYGFSCQWTPVELVLADTPTKTRELLTCVKQQLPVEHAIWQYAHTLSCYPDIQSFQANLNHYINTGQYKSVLMHIRSTYEPVIDKKLKQLVKLDDIAVLPASALTIAQLEQFESTFTQLNNKLNEQHIIAVAQSAHSIKPIAQYYALMTGKKLFEFDSLSSLTDLSHTSSSIVESITLFTTSSQCDHSFYKALKVLQTQCKVGIIAGQTPEVVSWHSLKNIVHHLTPNTGQDLILLPFENRSLAAAEANVICNDEFHAPTVQSFTTKEQLNSLSILSHGRGDMVYQQGHIFCGKSQTLLNAEPSPVNDARAPFCTRTGYCYKEGVLTYAETLTAKFVFLNTCFAYANIFPAQFTVGWALLKSDAAQVIASERAKDGTSIENIFAYCLYKQGYKTGDIVHYLNHVIRKTAMETESYLLFGDPTVCTYPYKTQHSALTVTHSDENVIIDISSQKPSHLLSFICAKDSFGHLSINDLFFYHKKKTDIKALHFCHDDKLYLFVFSLQVLPQQIILYSRSSQAVKSLLAKIHRCLHYAQHNETFKLTTGRS